MNFFLEGGHLEHVLDHEREKVLPALDEHELIEVLLVEHGPVAVGRVHDGPAQLPLGLNAHLGEHGLEQTRVRVRRVAALMPGDAAAVLARLPPREAEAVHGAAQLLGPERRAASDALPRRYRRLDLAPRAEKQRLVRAAVAALDAVAAENALEP